MKLTYFQCPPPLPSAPPSTTMAIEGTTLTANDVYGSDGSQPCTEFTTIVTAISNDNINFTAIAEQLPLELCDFDIEQYLPDAANKKDITLYIKRVLTDCGGTTTAYFNFQIGTFKGKISAVNAISCN